MDWKKTLSLLFFCMAFVAARADKPRYLWIEGSANFLRFADNRDNITRDLKKVKDVGFTDIVLDVRPAMGDVLFRTDKCEQVKRLPGWLGKEYGMYTRKQTWDYLQAFIDEGHKLGLRVNAGFNTFVGGWIYDKKEWGSDGAVFRNPNMRDWVTTVNTSLGLYNMLDLNTVPGMEFFDNIFLNPCSDEAQSYVLGLLHDLAANYPTLDGIVLDRCRFMGTRADFSELTRKKFVAYLDSIDRLPQSMRWPDDVCTPGMKFIKDAKTLPPLFKDFLTFRAKTIYDFVVKARHTVKAANPNVRLATYCGAWYAEYYENGVNWGSQTFDTSKEFPEWANNDYHKYGFAEQLDFLLLGCYCYSSGVYGHDAWTMQGFCEQARRFTAGKVPFAGGPDVGNPPGFEHGNVPNVVTSTVDACINAADGYFLFDLCHLRIYNYWDAVKKGIDHYLNAQKH